MSQITKLLAKIAEKPKDLTWDEAAKAMRHMGYTLEQTKGGSHCFFVKGDERILLPRPHANRKTINSIGVKHLAKLVSEFNAQK